MNPRILDATYRTRAIPLGSVRHFSWLFAAPAARDPLLGVYALQAEWNALTDPRTERSAAQIKLAWWQQEMRRLTDLAPVHPINCFLAALPGATRGTFQPLIDAVDAAALEVSGAPLERTTDLAPHAQCLRANPLCVAADLSEPGAPSVATDMEFQACVSALAVGDYLARSLREYREEARAGRVPFVVEELMAAGVDNAALAAERPDPQLSAYLASLRQRTLDQYAFAAARLPERRRRTQRHLLVLAALGAARLRQSPPRALGSLYLAWDTARRAALSRTS
jgi:15-cis-phytoene synthase